MRGIGRGRGRDVIDSGGGGGPPAPVIPATALASDGSTGQVASITSPLPNKNPITIRAYVKRITDPHNYSGFAALNKSGDELMFCGLGSDGDGLYMYCGSNDFGTGNTILADGNWHYVAYTYDGTTVKIYVPGESLMSQAIAQDGAAATSFSLFNTGFGSKFTGALAGVCVWNRVLDAAEIAIDYGTAQLDPTTLSSLYASYTCAEIVGGEIKDSSGNNRHLTVTGTLTQVTGTGLPLDA